MTRVLHVGAEIFPLVKTGGLGDVMAALPPALAAHGLDVRVLVPGYPAVMDALRGDRVAATLGPAFGAAQLRVRAGTLEHVGVPAYVLDAPALFARAGNPYQAPDGKPWDDNPLRFGALGFVAAHLGLGDIDAQWRADIVHGHDWHAGLATAYVAQHPAPACATVFTVRNLAFLGEFALDRMAALQLPAEQSGIDGLEFFGKGSFMKAGLQFADALTTVSPTYAREIQTPAFGCGLDGVIRARAGRLTGILNGVDTEIWNPATDAALPARYDAASLEGKREVKIALQRELGLAPRADAMLIGMVSRLSHQKGIDLLLDAAVPLLNDGVQIALLGGGDAALESAAQRLVLRFGGAMAVHHGYDEALAHRIVAGADVIAVPSRFEPCGLTQLYGLRYGTLPLVRRVGGLADTVIDADDAALDADRATGFVFDAIDAAALYGAACRALLLYRDPLRWTQMMRRAMAQSFSWRDAAGRYVELYAGPKSARDAELV
jgi:starch synthase